MSPVKGSFSSQGVTTPSLRTTGLEEGMGAAPISGLGLLFLDIAWLQVLQHPWSLPGHLGYILVFAGRREGERVRVWGDSIKDT